MLAQLSPDAYDIVLVDAPPLDESDDARVMAAGQQPDRSRSGRRARGPRPCAASWTQVRRMRLRLIGAVLLTRPGQSVVTGLRF